MAEDVTGLLHAWQSGNGEAARVLLPLVYEELRGLAARYMRAERPDHTLRATAVVHEAYLKLATHEGTYADRTHFYAVAARAMRQVLTDWARTANRTKRGGARSRVELLDQHALDSGSPDIILDISRLLDRLLELDARKAQALEMIFFGGMTYDEVASFLQVTPMTVHRDLKFAKAWMLAEMTKFR